MKKALFKWQTAGFVFTCLLGTLLHFLYDWSKGNVLVAVFSTVNESTWEHMKILFIPMFLFAILEKHLINVEFKNYWCVKFKGISLGVLMIPVLFYTYNGVFGTSPAWLNIAFFYFSALTSYVYEYHSLKKEKSCFISQTMAFSFLCLIAVAFLVFTFVQPQLPLFKDPVNGTFGM